MCKDCDSGNNVVDNFFTYPVMSDATKHLSCAYLAHQEMQSSIIIISFETIATIFSIVIAIMIDTFISLSFSSSLLLL